MDKNDVVLGITADATGVEAGVKRAKRSLSDLGRSSKDASQGIERIGDGGDKAAKKIARDTKTMERSLQQWIAKLEAGSKDSRFYWEKMADFKGVDKNALRPLLSQLDELKRKQAEVGDASSGLVSKLGGLQAAASLAVGGFAVQGLAQATKAMYDASSAAERLRIGLDFASARGSANEIAYLRGVTHDLGLEFASTAKAYQQFQAAAKGTAIEGDKARSVFEAVSKATAVMGLSADETSGVLLALQQMISKGTVQAEELRGQLGERLPGAFQTAARSMGVTTAELGKMLEQGEVVADDFLPKFAAELEKSLGDAPEKAANRLDASINRYNNAWELFKQSLGDTGVSKFWSGQMDILSDGLANFGQSIEGARASGAGFGGQLLAAAGAALEFINPLNAISYTAKEAGAQLKDAERRLTELKDAGAQSSSNLMLREAYNHAERLVRKLREAKAAQDSLAGLGSAYTDGMGNSQAITKQRADFSAAESALVDVRMRASGVTKQYQQDLSALHKAYELGVITQESYISQVEELAKRTWESSTAGRDAAKAAKEAAKGMKEGASGIQGYLKTLQARTAAQRLEIEQGDKLTETQRARIQLEQLLADSKTKATKSQIASAQAMLAEAEANEAWLQNQSEVAKALADMQRAREQSLRSVQDSVKKLVEEAEATAYAEQHNVSLAEAVERLALARAENAYQQAVERQEAPATLDALEKELQARKKIVELTAQKGVKEANDKAQEEIKKGWERTSQTIGDTLADYIMGGGKDAAEYLKRLFATLVLQPVVNYGVQSLMGAAGLGGGSGSGSGNAGQLLSLGKNAYSLFGGGMSAANSLGGMYANLTGTGIDGLLATNGAYGTAGGVSGTAGSALSSAISFAPYAAMIAMGMKMAGSAYDEGYRLSHKNWAAGWAATGGIAPPTLSLDTKILESVGLSGKTANILTGASLWAKGLSKLGIGGDPHEHSGGVYSNTMGRDAALSQIGLSGGARGDFTSRPNTSIDAALGSTIDGLLSIYTDMAERATGEVRKLSISAAFATNPISTDQDAYGYMSIADALTGAGIYGSSRRDGGGLGSDPEQAFSKFTGEIAGVLVGQLRAAGLPGWIDSIFASLGDSITLDGLNTALQQIAVIDTAFAGLGQQMAMFKDLSGSVQTTLMNVSGGIEGLSTNAASFYANFYSEQEKLDSVVASLTATFAQYGAELPTTVEQYRALVERQMAAGDAGAEFAAVLLSLNGTFKTVADTWKQELDGMSTSVGGFFTDLQSLIDGLSVDVESTRQSILRGTDVMTPEAIQAAIAGISTVGPSMGGVYAAQSEVARAAAEVVNRQRAADAANAYSGAQAGAAASAQAQVDAAAARRAQLQAEIQSASDAANSYWDGGVNSGYSYNKRKTWSDQYVALIENSLKPQLAAIGPEIQRLQSLYEQQASISSSAAAQAAGVSAQLSQAQAVLAAAQYAETQAKVQYAAEMRQFVIDAGHSVTKLGDLRGEVVSFYEAQVQAVQAMVQSAGNLRSVVDAVRMTQLSTAQTAQELGQRYAVDYSMALATSGATRAGYVDSMAGNLGALSEALRAESSTSTDWRVQTAKLMAQATNAAGLLVGDAEAADYESVSLGLLDSIDAKLESLSGVAKSAEQIIADAIAEGTQAQLGGMRAIVAALKGEAIPAFASGGFHAGGLRLVGERGPELEVTGPSRIWNAQQTAAMLGGGNSKEVVAAIKALQDDLRRVNGELLRVQKSIDSRFDDWEVEGMPREREAA